MKSLFIVFLYLSGSYSFSAEIVSEQPAKQVKTYLKNLTVRAKCEVDKGGSDREGGVYGPYCSCVNASFEIKDVVRKAYPNAKEIIFPSAAWLTQPLNECGVKSIDVDGAVIYTVQ